MTDTDFYFGKIVKTHGLSGELTIRIDDDNVDFDSGLKYFLFDIQGAKIPFVVDKWGLHDNKIFVSFHDINTIEKARVYVGKSVYLPISMRPQLAEGEFFMSDLIGFTVIDKNHGELGKITDVIENTMQAIMSIDVEGKEVLIPYHDDFIEELDFEGKTLRLVAPDGLIDMYLNA